MPAASFQAKTLGETHDLESARRQLGIRTQAEFARVLELPLRGYQRLIASEGSSSRRKPPVRVLRLVQAYLDGYRPDDWPG